uniref:Uncharacterized protein n=1 Tax=Rhipicephalus appendiculatus TaxID=34631 RepID=A0A131YDG5_RHIAP
MNAASAICNVTRRTASSSKLAARTPSRKDARNAYTGRARTNNCHSSTPKGCCSNTKKDARNDRTSIHRTSANCHNCYFVCEQRAPFVNATAGVSEVTFVHSLTTLTSKQTCGASTRRTKRPNAPITS